jgi:hypothetical protein
LICQWKGASNLPPLISATGQIQDFFIGYKITLFIAFLNKSAQNLLVDDTWPVQLCLNARTMRTPAEVPKVRWQVWSSLYQLEKWCSRYIFLSSHFLVHSAESRFSQIFLLVS